MDLLTDKDKIVVIVGLPATGKTTLLNELQEANEKYSLYHTDDYIEHGFKESLYVMMRDLEADKNPYKIIEGVQAYRLLRKGLELKTFYADLVITCSADYQTRLTRYQQRGENKDFTTFDKTLGKIWSDYISDPEINNVRHIHYHT